MTRGRAALGEFFPGSARRPINHGTIGGHRAHYRHGVPMCEPCRDADRQARGIKPRPPAHCGTRSGYQRHWRLSEPICAACRAANSQYRRRYLTARRAS